MAGTTGAKSKRTRKKAARKQSASRKDTRARAAQSVVSLRVDLVGIEPPIFRCIEVPDDYTFFDLHVALQDAMGWLDCHLHVFVVPGVARGKPTLIGIPDADGFAEMSTQPGWGVPISRFLSKPGDSVAYEYDFGDGWQHQITVQGVRERKLRERLPSCIDGARACPPEDCGGPFGYQHLLEVLSDPSHEEHGEMREWIGGRFDPARFDPKRVQFDDPQERLRFAREGY